MNNITVADLLALIDEKLDRDARNQLHEEMNYLRNTCPNCRKIKQNSKKRFCQPCIELIRVGKLRVTHGT